MSLKKIILNGFVFLVFIFSHSLLTSQELVSDGNSKWLKVSGSWNTISTNNVKFHFQERVSAYPWNYNELLNYHSIASIQPFDKYTRMLYTVKIGGKRNNPVEMLLFFNTELSETSKYQNFHGFQLQGDKSGFRNVSFIRSHWIEETTKVKKGNFSVSILSTKSCAIPFSSRITCEIRVNNKTAALFINNTKVHEFSNEAKLDNGIVGIGIRNAQFYVYGADVFKDSTVLLHDDFSQYSIKQLSIKAKSVSKQEYDHLKKQGRERNKK